MSGRSAGGPSAVARTEACLARIAALDPGLHAFITVTADSALEAAHAADAAARRGDATGLLHGMPVAVKDCIDVGGVRCTRGSAFFADRIAGRDAAVVTRLRAAGAILLGKTNLHEFAFGGTSQNAFFGGCRNPWDRSRIPGGSSGGSAVAVAAGLAAGALGSDTGSSIRMPAALTGVSGLRPTHGTVPADGVFPVSPPLDIVGPLAGSVADLARMQAAIADGGAVTSDPLRDRLGGGLDGLRVAIPDDFFFGEAEDAVAEAVLAGAKVLEGLGARLVSASIEGAAEVQSHLMPILIADAADLHRERLAADPARFGDGVLARLRPGLAMSAVDYAHSLRWLEAWRRRAAAFFRERADVMITPTVPVTAPEIGDDAKLTEVTRRLSRFCWTAPAAGAPALTVPCGLAAGLPIGMQILAGRRQDARLLNIGYKYQEATEWHRLHPADP